MHFVNNSMTDEQYNDIVALRRKLIKDGIPVTKSIELGLYVN